MANTLRSTTLQAQSSVFPGRRVANHPPTGIAPVCLWLLSQRARLGRGAPRLSTAPSAGRSRRWSAPTSWLAGLLLFALASALGLGVFAAPLASVPVVSALSLVGALWIVRRGPTARRDRRGGDRPVPTLRIARDRIARTQRPRVRAQTA
jgi:hypothetical protein